MFHTKANEKGDISKHCSDVEIITDCKSEYINGFEHIKC
jgi:hypothetical protein